MRKIKLFLSLLMVMLLSVGNVWATTYKLTKVTSVEAGKLYVFERNSHVFNNTSSSSALQTTATYNTSGLEGTESYVWTLESATGGFYLKNVSLASNQYLNNASKTTVSFGAASSIWTIAFTGEVALISNTSNSNRFLGDAGKDSPNNTYKAYATGNLNDYQHDITVYVLDEEGSTPPTPAKTLVSVAVSGAPTKTAYYAGDEFDPAGLTVTGHYSDNTDAPITSGITWAYDPSQELALNQTSIGVTATVSEIASPKFNVTGLTVSAVPAASNWQVTAPSDLATGDVVVLTMLKNSVYYAAPNNGTGAPAATVVAVANSKLSNSPAETLQWTVTVVSEGVYQFSKGTNYLKCTDANNGVRVGTGDYNTFDINTTNDKQYLHTTETMTSAENGRYLGIYNTQDWRCYSSVNNNIKDGSLVIFREPASSKEAAGLAFETAAYLVKANGSLATPTLTNPNNLTVTYTSSDANVVAVNETTGALTIKAAGKAEITASSDETETYKAGSATYTVYVAAQAGTAEDPLTEASAVALIDLGCTMSAHVTGTIQGKTYYSNSGSYNVTLTNGFLFYYFYAAENSTPFESDILTNGDELVGYGQLMKYGNNYEINPSYMVSRVPYSEPLVDISNTPETAYTPAQAISLYNNPTSDLTKEVYVKGVVVATPALKYNDGLTGDAAVYNGTYNVYVKAEDDLSENPTKFEFFRMYADDNNTTFEDGDIQVGEVIIAKGILSKYNSTYEFAQGCQMYSKKSKVTMTFDDLEMEVEDVETLAPKTITLATTETVSYDIKEGSDECVTLEGTQLTATAAGTATIVATVATTEEYIGTSVEFAVTVSAAPDTRKVANSAVSGFTATSGNLEPADIAFESFRGGNSNNDPIVYNNTKGIRLYQRSGTNAYGNFVTLTAAHGYTIDQVVITTTSSYSTTVAYSVDGNETLSESENVSASSTYSTPTGLNKESVNILNTGSGSSGRLEIASIKVYYTGEAAVIDHYELGGTYTTEFEVDNEFNHEGLIVYAAYDAQGDDKEDITAACTFSEPDMSEAGEKTIEITYKEAVVKSYTINVTEATPDTRKVANGPATFTTIKGDLTPSDIAFEAFKGGSSTDPANYNDGIRLYQIGGSNAFGGYLALTAVKGCAIDQVAITTTSKYETTVAYSIDGNENLLDEEAVAKSGEYTTSAGLNAKNVNILNLGTGSDGRLEIASIKVWYTGNAIAIDHYELGGTYATEFDQYDEFNHDGLIVYAAYDAQGDDKEDITAACTFSEPDMSEAGEKTIEITYKEVVVKSYTITVNASAKEDPAFEYSPASATITAGDVWSAPTLNKAFEVSPISYESSKPAVAAVDENGEITLAGGYGTAVITASFAGDDNYLASEATYTITVNEPGDDLTGTWVLASSISAGDKFIVVGSYNNKTMAMGKQNSNNRAAVASSVDEWNVLTPGAGTKVFTLVDAGDDKFAIQASNGKYLSAAGTGNNNYLREAADFEADNAKWTISIENGVANVVASSNNRNVMRYNSTNNSELFSCYQSGAQRDIQIFKLGTPDYGSYQRNVTSGNYGTICLPQAGTISGATLFEIASFENEMIYMDEVIGGVMEAGKPYIFQATADQLNVTYTSGEQVPASNANGLHGFYNLNDENAQFDIEENAGNYILYSNAYWLVSGRAAYIANYRAYIKLNDINNTGNQAPGRRRVAMAVHGEQTATGMESIQPSEISVQKVLINGQLFILRGEKMYDVKGQLVK